MFMRGRRRRGARVVRVVLLGLAVGHVLEALWLRQRRSRIEALDDSGTSSENAAQDTAGMVAVAAEGVEVDERTLAAAAAEMARTGVDVVDLVPADLPTDRALRLLRWVDPEQLGRDPMYTPAGAHEAMVLAPSVGERMGFDPGANGATRLGRGELVRTAVKAQQYAPAATTLRVAPGLSAGPVEPVGRWREWEELTAGGKPYVAFAPVLAGMETAHLLAMTAGLLVAPGAALAALVTWSVQPQLVFGPRQGADDQPAWQPPDLESASMLRLPRSWARNLRTILAGVSEGRAKAAQRPAVPEYEPPPVEECFEPRQDTCPWCGSKSLTDRLDLVDFFQNKPGEFHVDECLDCGHVFENPAPTDKALEYYYRDFYGGVADVYTDAYSALQAPFYEDRLDTISQFISEPRTWLDVGSGHGHFCLAARQRWPEASFHGLDMSEIVEEAQRRGWIDTAHRGFFPDLAESLPRYDVVTMHHYLEHTREPRREVAAAAKVLEPGGLLEIEVPNPESPWSRWLGRYWLYWGQPQHLHFVTCDNLAKELEELGFEVVSAQRAILSQCPDFTAAVLFGVQTVSRSPHMPWLPAPSMTDRAKRVATVAAAAPALSIATVLDRVKDLPPFMPENGDGYRIFARKV